MFEVHAPAKVLADNNIAIVADEIFSVAAQAIPIDTLPAPTPWTALAEWELLNL